MPVTVNYQNRIGYYTQTDKLGNIVQEKQVWMCHANCLMALMIFYKDEETGEEMAQFNGFFGDIQHVKNLFENSGFFDGLSDFHFYAKEMDDDVWEFARLLTEHGIKVTIE